MEAVDLPDINVWPALVDPDHEHHERAKVYWNKESAAKLAFTRITMLDRCMDCGRRLHNAIALGFFRFRLQEFLRPFLLSSCDRMR